MAEEFQNNPEIGLFIGGLRAVKEGMDLYAASNSCFLELGWTPGEHNQAEDRLHRIGQKNAVTAWYLVAENTIEEEIAEILDDKKQVLTMILDGEEVHHSSLLTELLKTYKEDK
jgi:SNF2 family DNA or RNA helicase